MWWLREIDISNEDFLADIGRNYTIVLPEQSPEAACGWASILSSNSGRLQVGSYGWHSLF